MKEGRESEERWRRRRLSWEEERTVESDDGNFAIAGSTSENRTMLVRSPSDRVDCWRERCHVEVSSPSPSSFPLLPPSTLQSRIQLTTSSMQIMLFNHLPLLPSSVATSTSSSPGSVGSSLGRRSSQCCSSLLLPDEDFPIVGSGSEDRTEGWMSPGELPDRGGVAERGRERDRGRGGRGCELSSKRRRTR